RLELNLNTSYEFISGDQNDPRSFELSANYSYPRFAFPFRAFNNDPGFLNPRTRFQLSYAQIRQINFNVDNNLRFNLRFQANHDRTTTSFFDLIELEWFDASITQAFRESIENDTDDPLLTQLILEDYRPQISSVLRYTFRNSATHPIRRDDGFFLESSFEVGGNLPYLLENTLIDRPDSLRSTIPSFSSSGQELAYSQFVKASFDYRSYRPIGPNSVLAWRGFAGMAQTYGLSRSIPITRRFFAGGSNDIRGWDPLTLGPGRNDQDRNPINGGDIKLAAYLEYRNTFSRNFLSTDWIFAIFTDAGNVWNGPRNEISEGRFAFDQFYKEIAVGSGIGLRLDWEFVVLRLDLAYRLTDLGIEPGTNILERNTIHFGIGHSF
ncbi:MAG: BamA/TamA family outer membrane protein, partial [Cyclonatronaceae bacterium]